MMMQHEGQHQHSTQANKVVIKTSTNQEVSSACTNMSIPSTNPPVSIINTGYEHKDESPTPNDPNGKGNCDVVKKGEQPKVELLCDQNQETSPKTHVDTRDNKSSDALEELATIAVRPSSPVTDDTPSTAEVTQSIVHQVTTGAHLDNQTIGGENDSVQHPCSTDSFFQTARPPVPPDLQI